MTTMMRGIQRVALLGAVLAGAGCSNLGGLGNVLGSVLQPAGSGSGEVAAVVRYVDTQRQMIQVQTQNGQTGNIYFDNRTQVVYGQQQYPVTSLEQGDQVQMRIQQDQQGNAYTDYIVVTRSVQDSGGYNNNTGGYNNGSSGYTTAEGRVAWVDYNSGQFGITTTRGNLTVVMPYNSNATSADRFRRLRQNDYVRVEGQLVSNARLELSRFY